MKRILSLILSLLLIISLVVGTGNAEGTAPEKCAALEVYPQTVTFTQKNMSLQLEVTKNPEGSSGVITFLSSDSEVVSVSEDGVLKAVGEGTAVIIITCGEITEYCVVICAFAQNSPPPAEQKADGACYACGGTGACENCNGSPVCPDCKGSGKQICLICGGDPDCHNCANGVCPSCLGRFKDIDYTCSSCGGDHMCPGCGGDGKVGRDNRKCVTCKGNGECPLCDVNGEIITPFGRPVCMDCGVSGKCVECDGVGTICTSCAGGYVKCTTCTGTGKVCHECDDGKCPSCGGANFNKREANNVPVQANNTIAEKSPVTTGQAALQTSDHCSSCNGTGYCSACDGIGGCSNYNCILGTEKCSSCYGTGDCDYCYGRGMSFDAKCPRCHGSGNCRACIGLGEFKCATCKGTGQCYKCKDSLFCTACGGSGK